MFEGLSIWQEEKYRELQGTYPVIFLSFSSVKETSFSDARKKICQIMLGLYIKYSFLLEGDYLSEKEKQYYQSVSVVMENYVVSSSLRMLSEFLYRYYGKRVIILLDEYDTPMQEAYLNGYWEEMVAFTRGLFQDTFKTNSYLERGLLTGITRISKESIFSDMNNLEVVTTTSEKYETAFALENGRISIIPGRLPNI